MKKQLTVCAIALLSVSVYSSGSLAGQYQKGSGAHLSKFIGKFDTDGDNNVTKEEFDTSMEQRFNNMDADNNSVVTRAEFKNNSKAKHKDYKKKIKAKIDTDNDGLISKQEFLDARLKRAEKKFAKLDKDNDGFLTEEESKSKKGKSRFKRPKHYFSKIDANGDGIISFSEMKASAERMFQKLDSNGDQVITQDEIQAISQMRRMRR